MTSLTRTVVFAGTFLFAVAIHSSTTHAAFTTPARSGVSSGPSLDVNEALKISSHEEVLDIGVRKMEALSAMLARVTDERSARDICPVAERCYIELQLIAARGTMLPPPTAEERSRLADGASRFATARAALDRETARLADNAPLAYAMRSVMYPLYGQLKDLKKQQDQSLSSTLQTLRSQIELYKLQHRDELPDFRHKGWGPLTGKTTADGSVTARGPYGPYLQSPPRNPLNNNTMILIVRGAPNRDFRYEKNDCGFIFDEQSGRLWGIDAAGRLFAEPGMAHASTD